MIPGHEGERYGGEVNEGEDQVAELEAGGRVRLHVLWTAALCLVGGRTSVVAVQGHLCGGAGHEVQDVEEMREDEDDDGGRETQAVAPSGVFDGVAVHRDGVLAFSKWKACIILELFTFHNAIG